MENRNNIYIKFNGLDDALIGFDDYLEKNIYSIDLILELLMSDGISYEEAYDYFFENVFGAFDKSECPVIINRLTRTI